MVRDRVCLADLFDPRWQPLLKLLLRYLVIDADDTFNNRRSVAFGFFCHKSFLYFCPASLFCASLKCRSLSRSSPQGEPGGFLPRSMPHLMFGRLRSTSASMNGRMSP